MQRKYMWKILGALILLAALFFTFYPGGGAVSLSSGKGVASKGAVEGGVSRSYPENDNEMSVPAGVPEMGKNISSGGVDSTPSGVDTSPKVIKTANVSISVEKDQFDTVLSQEEGIVSSCGGTMVGSNLRRGDNPYFRGQYKVPADTLQVCVGKLKGLSDDVSVEISSRDVTGEYVDVSARLAVLEEEKKFYMSLLSQAETVDEMLKVRRYLDDTIAQIESMKARLNYINEHSAYSTLVVSIGRKITPPPEKPWYIRDLENALMQAFHFLWVFFLALIKATVIVVPLFFLLFFLGMWGYSLYTKMKGKEG